MSNDVECAVWGILSMIFEERLPAFQEISYKQILEPINGYEVFLDNDKAVYIHKSVVDDYLRNPAYVEEDSISRIVGSLHESNE